MDTSTKEELFRKVWAALYEEGNKDELQVREVVDQMYMAVKEPELDIEEVFDKVQREIGTVRNKERRLWWNVISVIVKTCSDSLFSIGQKNCQLFVAKLRNFLDSHNRMVLY